MVLALPRMIAAAPNNGMHPTPCHAASHAACAGARVMPGVGRLRVVRQSLLHEVR